MIQLTNLSANWTASNPIIPKGEFALEIDTNKVKLGDGLTPWNSLSYLVDASTTPLTNQTYSGQFNLSTNYEVEYNEYTTNVAETPTISATPLIDAIAGVIMKAGVSASLVTTNMGAAWPGNDTFTANKSNFVAVMQKKPDTVSSTGLWYIIKVLN